MTPTFEKEFAFTSKDFETLRGWLRQSTGIALNDAKRELVYSRLAPRLRSLGLADFGSYIGLLESNRDERVRFINALTTNLTSFFRERHHFEFLGRYLQSVMHSVRIWSSASSTGEEPYSLAMTLAESGARGSIIATDLDSDVLGKASAGIYTAERVSELEPALLKRWFLRGAGPHQGRVRVKPELQALLEFRQLNLIDSNWSVQPGFHVIFCRNVAIYFDKPTQARLFQRLVDHLVPGGYLMVGHSESLLAMSNLRSLGQTIYQKEA